MGDHFQGKDPLTHVLEARRKGKIASSEIHGAELPGHYCAAADSAKETALLLLVLWTLLTEIGLPADQIHWFLVVFLGGWLVWRVGRSAILGWSRLERLHRVIEEERWEIEHRRGQEKDELKALYAAKGFSGRLLDEAVEVMMADDNRLLQVMLTEELGLSLESFEHPLKQAFGSAVGVIGASVILAFGLFALPWWGTALSAALVISLSAGTTAQMEKNRPAPAIVWNLAVAALSAAASYLLGQLLLFP